MNKPIVLFVMLLFALGVAAQEHLSALLPFPNHVEQRQGVFRLSNKETIGVGSGDLRFAAAELQQVFKQRFGFAPAVADNGRIRLMLNPRMEGEEQYRLTVDAKGISIEGRTAAGVYYGVMTLDQLLLGDVANTKQGRIQAVRIDDAPAYPFRALMLDPARHFLPVEAVKGYIDCMARYKFNTLQLHLSDDQGWRIEIKSHPKLTEVGAFRNPKAPAISPDNGYYMQEQIRELVEYAALRNVEIIPEIDVPGHTAAILTAYPDLRCDFLKDSAFVFGKTDNVMLSAANPKVYEVLDDIIREVGDVFPSKKIHLGGDESAIERNWAKSPENLELMRSHGYTSPDQLMNVFFGKVLASAKKYGLHAILWCELDNIRLPADKYLFDYPQDVTLVTWRYGLTPKCIELTRESGNTLILAPGEYTYFDYPQYANDLPEFNNWGMPLTTLRKTYEFDPTYKLEPGQRKHIAGVMGTLWGEAIKDINRANYMTYPRGLALSEAGWTRMSLRSWDSFRERLYPNLLELMKRGVSFRVPFEIAGEGR
ncbi:beta-N-acetylhexosaminidase [Bacteroides pyogenes]|uniref:beta-N-acetylhexosaminidase n=1 Tax=Bacteroides pyogenes TaxID=310300 RepID=UPI003F95F055